MFIPLKSCILLPIDILSIFQHFFSFFEIQHKNNNNNMNISNKNSKIGNARNWRFRIHFFFLYIFPRTILHKLLSFISS